MPGRSSTDSVVMWINDDSGTAESPPASLRFLVGSGSGTLVMEVLETGVWDVHDRIERSVYHRIEDSTAATGDIVVFKKEGTSRLTFQRPSSADVVVRVSSGIGNAWDLDFRADTDVIVRLDTDGAFTGATNMQVEDGAGIDILRVSDYGQVNFTQPSTALGTLTFAENSTQSAAVLSVGSSSKRGILQIGRQAGASEQAGLLLLSDRIGGINYVWVSTETTVGKVRADLTDPGTTDTAGVVVGGIC